MGFRIGKSIRVLPGVHLTISTSGIGYSVGSRNLKLTRHPDGRVSRTVGIGPVRHSSTIRPAPSRSPHPAPAPAPVPPAPGSPPAPVPPALGPPAPPPVPSQSVPPPPVPPPRQVQAWERDLLDAERTGRYADVARRHGRTVPAARVLAAVLDGLSQADPVRARELLGWAVAQGADLSGYLPDRTWPVEIATGVVAQLRLADDVARLAVAELHQAAGDLDTAIWTVEGAQPTAPAALSLVELYSDAGRDHDVIDMTDATTNQDDATALLLVLRGSAFGRLGEYTAALAAFGEALRMQARAAPVRTGPGWSGPGCSCPRARRPRRGRTWTPSGPRTRGTPAWRKRGATSSRCGGERLSPTPVVQKGRARGSRLRRSAPRRPVWRHPRVPRPRRRVR